MTKIYFVRHAQPDHSRGDNRTRPLTPEGLADTAKVLDFFKTIDVDAIYCSPAIRSIDTIKSTAEYLGKQINIDERLRERDCGIGANTIPLIEKRWSDKDFHEQDGESINMVQRRNIAALNDILQNNQDKTIIIGTHGTALTTILNHYDNNINFDSFMRIIDWTPYIIELNFAGLECINKIEHMYIHKQYPHK